MLKVIKNYFGNACNCTLKYSDTDLSASEALVIINVIAQWCKITPYIGGVNSIFFGGVSTDVEHVLEDIAQEGFELVY